MSKSLALSSGLRLVDGAEGQFLVLANDTGVCRTILESGTWAAEDVRLFKRLIRPGQTVLDIGANIGHHTVVFSKAVGKEGRVFSFEPQRFIFNLLCANLALNDCRNVSPFRLALGETDGRTRMLPVDYDRPNNFGALGLSTHSEWLTGESIRLARLDTFSKEEQLGQVDFIKIDVQTFELLVLKGATEVLTSSQAVLFVEISPYWMKRLNDYDYREIYDLLRKFGYELFDKQCKPLDLTHEAPVSESVEWDILAVRGEKKSLLTV